MDIWRPIAEFPGYEVSSGGLIRRVKPYGSIPAYGLMKTYLAGAGYVFIQFNKDRRKQPRYVHRLVGVAFLDMDPTLEINHIDGDKTNNGVFNLEVTTRSGNNRHKNRVLLTHDNQTDYIGTDPSGVVHKIPNLSAFAEARNLTPSACILAAQGKRNHHKGWLFAYA